MGGEESGLDGQLIVKGFNGTLPRPTHERVDASQIIVLSFIMVVQQNRIQN
jgi:hypothetical protein